jgi:para-nitrobenzyl esterase
MSDSRPDNGLNNCISLQTAQLASKHSKVHEFAFADPTPPPLTQDPGVEMRAVHSAELHYEFPHFSNTKRLDGPHLTAGVRKPSNQMLAYWTSFAATAVHHCSFWRELYPALLSR